MSSDSTSATNTGDESMMDEHEVDCELCGETFDHYDFLIDHVAIYHRPAEVYSHFSEDNPYK